MILASSGSKVQNLQAKKKVICLHRLYKVIIMSAMPDDFCVVKKSYSY